MGLPVIVKPSATERTAGGNRYHCSNSSSIPESGAKPRAKNSGTEEVRGERDHRETAGQNWWPKQLVEMGKEKHARKKSAP